MSRAARVAGFLLLAVVVLLGPASAANAKLTPGATVERAVRSESPPDGVAETFVRVYDPLPPPPARTLRRCDWITYLRFRHRPRAADRARPTRSP